MSFGAGPPCPAVDLDLEVRGYLAGLKALEADPRVDAGRVFILGLSIGGVEAPLLAAQERVHGVVVVNTVGKPFFEYLLDTRRRQMQLRHVPYDDIDRQMRAEEICNYRLLIEKQEADRIVAAMPDCRDRISYPASAAYMQQWAALNIAEQWKRVDVPVPVVYGTSDFVAWTADQPQLAAMINAFHPAPSKSSAPGCCRFNFLLRSPSGGIKTPGEQFCT